MKTLPVLLLSIFFILPLQAQDSLYFKDLYGFEDSKGQTHLYYQHINRDELEGKGYKSFVQLRHLNASTDEDTVLYSFHSDSYDSFIPPTSRSIKDLTMLSDDPDDIVIVGATGSGIDSIYEYLLIRKTGAQFYIYLGLFGQVLKDSNHRDSIYYHTPTPNMNPAVVSIHKDIHPDSLRRLEYLDSYQPTDSVGFRIYENIKLMAISPFADNVYFVSKEGESGLYKGTLQKGTFEMVMDESYELSVFAQFFFDSDSIHIYATQHDVVFRSDAFGDSSSWEEITPDFPVISNQVLHNGDSIRATNIHVNPNASGYLYAYSKSRKTLYNSTDYAETFSIHTTFDHTIQGVYHKPGTDSLYVLTIKDLFLIEGENQSKIDEVPLAVDENEIPKRPKSITLHQNYPNPFNPETTIQFELKEASQIQIDVFDILGRQVTRLMNERTSAGNMKLCLALKI